MYNDVSGWTATIFCGFLQCFKQSKATTIKIIAMTKIKSRIIPFFLLSSSSSSFFFFLGAFSSSWGSSWTGSSLGASSTYGVSSSFISSIGVSWRFCSCNASFSIMSFSSGIFLPPILINESTYHHFHYIKNRHLKTPQVVKMYQFIGIFHLITHIFCT